MEKVSCIYYTDVHIEESGNYNAGQNSSESFGNSTERSVEESTVCGDECRSTPGMEEYLKSGETDKCELHKYLADQIIKEWKKYTSADLLDEAKRRYIAKVCNNSNTSKGKLF